MGKQCTAALGTLVLALAIGGWAEAVPVNTCVAGQHIVDTGPEAADIGANGYSNGACELIIQVTIPVTVTTLVLTADKITIDPAGGPTPAVDVEIINNAVASEIFLSATTVPGGDIVINNGILKAHKLLHLFAKDDITARESELIGALNFGPPPSGVSGDLFITAENNVDIQTTTVHGAGIGEFLAKAGNLTLICGGGGAGVCRDPLLSSKAAELCDTVAPPGLGPEDFPCSVNFPTAASIREVCFPVPPDVQCNGGNKEKGFTGKNITVKGRITANDHMEFFAKGGRVIAEEADLKAESIDIFASGCPDVVGSPDPSETCINANSAKMTADTHITMSAASGAGLIDVCEADLNAPIVCLNGDCTKPFDPRVVDTAPECDDFVPPPGDGNKGPLVNP